MELFSRYNLDECQITLNQSTKSNIDVTIQVVKVTGFVFHLVFFVFVALVREFHTRSSIYLINLGVVSFLNLVDGVIAFNPDFMCLTGSKIYCAYQSIFIQYYSYLYSYAVVLLAFYRLMCSSSTRLSRTFKTWKIWILIVVSWLIPLLLVVISKFALNGPVVYNDILDACRISYKRRRGGFVFFVVCGFIVPTLIVASIYACILIRVKNIKKKVMNINSNHKERKMSGLMLSENQYNRSEIPSICGNELLARNVKFVSDCLDDADSTAAGDVIKQEDSIQNNDDVRRREEGGDRTADIAVICGSAEGVTTTTTIATSDSIKKKKSSDPMQTLMITTTATTPRTLAPTAAKKATKTKPAHSCNQRSRYHRLFFSTEFKLLVQFVIIFMSYFVYSISNILLTYQLSVTTDNQWDKELLKIFRLLIWLYHLINPIIFLSFHPIFLNKCAKFISYVKSFL